MTRYPAQPRPGSDDLDGVLPPKLVEDLAGLYPVPRVPPGVDAKVLSGAAATWWRQARFRRRVWWGGAAAAAAAAVLIVVLNLPRQRDVGPVAVQTPAPAGDVDGDGQVDILDAFSLARKVRDAKGNVPATRGEDVNGDGVIDGKDVDLIARMAVRASDTPVEGVRGGGTGPAR